MFKFGFEVEGFYLKDGNFSVPPKDYPHDDFPGLVEARTTGGGDIRTQLFMLYAEMNKWEDVDWSTFEFTFSGEQKRVIRSRHYEKGGVEISNIYGKSPRNLGNKTLASFQINISCFDRSVNHELKTGGWYKQDFYRLFDFVNVVRALDKEFASEISESKRQPGFYSIKDDIRLEYRSLPNCVIDNFPGSELIKRIQKCVE